MRQYIDHTLLKPDATKDEIRKLCEECRHFRFAAVCVQPIWVPLAVQMLKGGDSKICSVVGFPLGANSTATKAHEASELATAGAHELDMVMNIGALKSKEYETVRKDVEAVVKSAPSALIKVIIETCLLDDEEKRVASLLCTEAGAHFVKTSTGFSKAGATGQDVALLRSIVGPDMGVKASGGIRDLATALSMIKAGATRIGTSSGVAIIEESK